MVDAPLCCWRSRRPRRPHVHPSFQDTKQLQPYLCWQTLREPSGPPAPGPPRLVPVRHNTKEGDFQPHSCHRPCPCGCLGLPQSPAPLSLSTAATASSSPSPSRPLHGHTFMRSWTSVGLGLWRQHRPRQCQGTRGVSLLRFGAAPGALALPVLPETRAARASSSLPRAARSHRCRLRPRALPLCLASRRCRSLPRSVAVLAPSSFIPRFKHQPSRGLDAPHLLEDVPAPACPGAAFPAAAPPGAVGCVPA